MSEPLSLGSRLLQNDLGAAIRVEQTTAQALRALLGDCAARQREELFAFIAAGEENGGNHARRAHRARLAQEEPRQTVLRVFARASEADAGLLRKWVLVCHESTLTGTAGLLRMGERRFNVKFGDANRTILASHRNPLVRHHLMPFGPCRG